MDSEVVLYGFLIVVLAMILIVVIGAFLMVAIWIPTVLGLKGLMWWAVAIVSFSVLMGLGGGLTASRRD